MKRYFLIILFHLPIFRVMAQIPSNCIEIESILVDACGSPEGENEMVRFQVGPNPINLASMTVSWPNNSWLGLCQNATTASIVSTWNSTITECGLLIEPIGGIIPAGERVIMVTSTNVIPTANSFAGLSDTLYVIFQCAGNTNGHFANWGTGLRTLTINIGACSDVVTYNRALLEDQLGNNVAADGATVIFDWAGSPDYINEGCIAPVIPSIVDAGNDQTGFCLGDTVNLTAFVQGSFTSFQWSGGTGTFINSTSLNANYIIGAGDVGSIMLVFSATNCNGSITDTVEIQLGSPPGVIISPGGPVNICNGDTVTLTAIGPGPFVWNTLATTSSIVVTNSGNYIVTQNTACGSSTDTVVVNNNGLPPVATITPMGSTDLCAGDTIVLQGSGGINYQWNTGDFVPIISTAMAGNYSLIVTNLCGSDTAFITLNSSPSPNVNISPTSPIDLCLDSVAVTASGTGTFTWNTGATGNVETYYAPGNYFVVASNSCGTDTAFFIIQGGNLTAGFTASPASGNSPLTVNFNNTSTNADFYNWIFGNGNTSNDINPSFLFTIPGTYTVTLIATNAAGCADTAFYNITVDSCIYSMQIPNVFTPDGNTVNDTYYTTGNCADEFHAYFFDRWGVKVYEYHDASASWDGSTFTGSQITKGIYSYIIFVRDYNGDQHKYHGFIHVFE